MRRLEKAAVHCVVQWEAAALDPLWTRSISTTLAFLAASLSIHRPYSPSNSPMTIKHPREVALSIVSPFSSFVRSLAMLSNLLFCAREQPRRLRLRKEAKGQPPFTSLLPTARKAPKEA